MTGIHDLTMRDVVHRYSHYRKEEVAFVFGDKRWTFGQYSRDVDNLASGLTQQGIQKGDRIGVLAFNSFEYFLLYGAAAYTGAVLLVINWRLKIEEIQMILEDCAPKALVVDSEFVDVAEQLKESSFFVTHWLVSRGSVENFDSLQDLLKAGDHCEEIEINQEDPYLIIPTAAVGGKPRGAVLAHRNFVAAGLQNMADMGINHHSVYLNAMPLYHVMGLEIALTVLYAGGCNVILKRFDAKEAVESIDRERVSVIATVPPILSTILDESARTGRALNSLRLVAGLLEDPETIKRCQKVSKAQFWGGFGQTETTGYVTCCPYDESPGSSGRAGLMARIRLVDEYDREVEIGQEGEVVVRGPLVFNNYWNMKEESDYVFRNGWHHTGDICRMDESGYLWYVRRKAEKELIKPGGENVYPAEVEKSLLEHPDVLEACVFGVPDKEWGEAIKAVCSLKTDSTLEVQELIDFVGSRIARYKKPKHIEFVESLPKKVNGSVDREMIKAEHKIS
jgi:long-chain acyl-CoA synthetase